MRKSFSQQGQGPATLLDVLERHGLTDRRQALDALRGRDSLAQVVTGDLGNVLAKTAARVTAATFQAMPPTWEAWALAVEVDRLAADVSHAIPTPSLSVVQAGGPYPQFRLVDAKTSVALQKRGASFDVSWELMVNDDQAAIEAGVRQLTQAAIEAEDDRVYSVLAAAAGSFTAATSAAAPGDGALDQGAGQLGNLTNAAGEKLNLRVGAIVCPAASAARASAAVHYHNLAVDPSQRITVVGSTRLTGTRWYIVPRREQLPIVAVAFLKGSRQPELVQTRRADGITFTLRHPFDAKVVNTKAITNAGA